MQLRLFIVPDSADRHVCGHCDAELDDYLHSEHDEAGLWFQRIPEQCPKCQKPLYELVQS